MNNIPSLAAMLEETCRKLRNKEALLFEGRSISYHELDEQANRTANALAGLGITKGDRVAIMLPNTPEFVYTFYGIQKLGAVAVPFNTMYKGREITHILKDSGARAIVALSNFAPLLNEIKTDVPNLEHIILTGQRTLVFAQENSTAFVQMIVDTKHFATVDEAFTAVGRVLVSALERLGVEDAWYKHQGSVRAGGKKIASILINVYKGQYIINTLVFLDSLDIDSFFKVIWVPPEVKDKAVEPMTSVREQSGHTVAIEEFRDAFTEEFQRQFNADIVPGDMKTIERLVHKKTRSQMCKT